MKIRTALAVVAITGSLAGTAAGTAAFAGTGADCPSSHVCLYDYYGFDGFLGSRATGMARTSISAANNDKLASWINKSTTTNAAWYPEKSGGPCYTMARNSTDSTMAIGFRDTASSWKTNGGC